MQPENRSFRHGSAGSVRRREGDPTLEQRGQRLGLDFQAAQSNVGRNPACVPEHGVGPQEPVVAVVDRQQNPHAPGIRVQSVVHDRADLRLAVVHGIAVFERAQAIDLDNDAPRLAVMVTRHGRGSMGIEREAMPAFHLLPHRTRCLEGDPAGEQRLQGCHVHLHAFQAGRYVDATRVPEAGVRAHEVRVALLDGDWREPTGRARRVSGRESARSC